MADLPILHGHSCTINHPLIRAELDQVQLNASPLAPHAK